MPTTYLMHQVIGRGLEFRRQLLPLRSTQFCHIGFQSHA